MSRKLKIWGLLSVIVLACSITLFITIGTLSSELGWLYFSGVELTPSNYFIYYIEQLLGGIVLASVISAVIWFITVMIEVLRDEIRGKSK